WVSHFDDYDEYMRAGSAGELGHEHGLEQVGFWRKILEHPSYDAFWQEQAMDKILAARPLKVPTMLVHSLWDQEDIYGAVDVLLIPQAVHQHRRDLERPCSKNLVHSLFLPESVIAWMFENFAPEADLLKPVLVAEFACRTSAHVFVVVIKVADP